MKDRIVNGLSRLKYRGYDSAGVAIMNDAKTPISKAIFSLSGFDTRFLPATKVMLKERMLIVGKPLIQYTVEEANPAGIDTLIFVKGQNNRVKGCILHA